MTDLTEQDRNNLIAFLNRVEYKGIQEAQILLNLVQKLSILQQQKKGED